MKRLRLEKWPGQLLAARPGAATSRSRSSLSPSCPRVQVQALSNRGDQFSLPSLCRHKSTATTALNAEAEIRQGTDGPASTSYQTTSSSTATIEESPQWPTINTDETLGPFPSPLPNRALKSAKLAALHARLALSDKIPLQTLARTLVDASADPAPLFNNINLAFLGQTLISYHTSEVLMCRYPRLPMEILHSAMRTYAGDKTLYYVARSWGIENAASPGAEVDPGLLQFSLDASREFNTKWGFVRPEAEFIEKFKWRRGISSRVVLDDDFGDAIKPTVSSKGLDVDDLEGQDGDEMQMEGLPTERQLSLGNPDEKMAKSLNIHGTFVRAVVGAIYTHAGREAARSFIKSHILSRQLDLAQLFTFKMPVRELARLCGREEFDPPVARLLSETGRLSRTPVFVVGIFSGNDKLGEGSAASLEHARQKAAMNALKAWYLYSPGEDVRVPSEMLSEGATPWEPVYVDIGEVI